MGELVNFENNIEKRKLNITLPPYHDERELNSKTSYEGGNSMYDNVKRNEYENFKNHIDTKFDKILSEMNTNQKEIRNEIRDSRIEMNTNINSFKSDIKSSVNQLPTNSDIENKILRFEKQLFEENKKTRNNIIGWSIAGISLIFTVTKALGWI